MQDFFGFSETRFQSSQGFCELLKNIINLSCSIEPVPTHQQDTNIFMFNSFLAHPATPKSVNLEDKGE